MTSFTSRWSKFDLSTGKDCLHLAWPIKQMLHTAFRGYCSGRQSQTKPSSPRGRGGGKTFWRSILAQNVIIWEIPPKNYLKWSVLKQKLRQQIGNNQKPARIHIKQHIWKTFSLTLSGQNFLKEWLCLKNFISSWKLFLFVCLILKLLDSVD